MHEHRFHFDLRDTQFVLFEQLRVDERLFRLSAFADFTRSDVERLLVEGLRFAQKVLAPANAAGDAEGCRFEDGRVFLPSAYRSVFAEQARSGWIGMTSDPAYGGQGLPLCIGLGIAEAFVGANCALAMLPGLTETAADLIVAHGREELRQRYARPLLAGRWQGTMCLTEPQAGSAVGSIQTTATNRDGRYCLRGHKIFISGGEHDLVENVIHLVLARIEGAPAGTKGLSLFLVPKRIVEANGSLGEGNDVTCVGIEEKLGIHGSPTCAMSFGDNDRCEAFLVGKEQQGIAIMFEMMNAARVGVGLQGLALGSAAYLSALDYARGRIQGVETKNFRNPDAPLVPITAHPDVRRMLATMKVYCEGCRSLLLKTAMALDLGAEADDDALRERMRGRAELLTPICKAYCSDVGFEVTSLALQTLGGHGYLKDYPIEQLLRDARIAPIYEGTNGIQALDLLGRKIGRQQGRLFLECMSDLGQFLDAQVAHPTLGPFVAQLAARKTLLEATTMNFAVQQMSGDLDLPLLSAVPYLRMFGHVMLGWLLLEQAVIADEALSRLAGQQGAISSEARAALVSQHPEAQFYDNKVKSARFFISRILPENDGLAAAIATDDRSALEMHF